jgi:hypothetical protein
MTESSHLLLGNATEIQDADFCIFVQLKVCADCYMLNCPRSDNDQGLRMRKQNEKKEFCIPKGDYYKFTGSHT